MKQVPVIVFVCEKCETKYFTKEEAEKCEAQKLRPQVFKVGDKVGNVGPYAYCFMEDKDTSSYSFQGEVVEVLGPFPRPAVVDRYYRNARGQEVSVEETIPIGTHAFKYRVVFRCPNCKKDIARDFFDCEIEAKS